MATINTTSRHLNQDKRYGEAITVAQPAVQNKGGGRTNLGPTYYKYGDTQEAYVIPANSIVQKIYLNVTEAFPAGSVVVVNVAGQEAIAVTQSVAAVAFVKSTLEDVLVTDPSKITITITGGGTAGDDITSGNLYVVAETIPFLEKNGRYSSFPHSNDTTQAR